MGSAGRQINPLMLYYQSKKIGKPPPIFLSQNICFCLDTNIHTNLDSQTSRGELLVVAFVQAVLSHQRGEMLQTVSMPLRGGDVQQIVCIFISD